MPFDESLFNLGLSIFHGRFARQQINVLFSKINFPGPAEHFQIQEEKIDESMKTIIIMHKEIADNDCNDLMEKLQTQHIGVVKKENRLILDISYSELSKKLQLPTIENDYCNLQ